MIIPIADKEANDRFEFWQNSAETSLTKHQTWRLLVSKFKKVRMSFWNCLRNLSRKRKSFLDSSILKWSHLLVIPGTKGSCCFGDPVRNKSP